MSVPAPTRPERNDADDLFDLPVEALNLPGMDAVDTAAALAAFKRAEPAIAALADESDSAEEFVEELSDEQLAEPSDDHRTESPTEPVPRSRRIWIGIGGLLLGSLVALLPGSFRKSPTAPSSAVVAPTAVEDAASSVEHASTSASHSTHVVDNTSLSSDPKPSPAEHAPSAAQHTPPTVDHTPRSSEPEPLTAEHTPPARPEVERRPAATPVTAQESSHALKSSVALEAALPPVSRSGPARLRAVESALDAGQRASARLELGRILLDIDALPAAEREETRAQAELLVARTLQDAADEARKAPR